MDCFKTHIFPNACGRKNRISEKRDGEYQVYKKYYENDNEGQVKVPSLIEGISNNDGKEELKILFNISEGRDNVFYTVKPTSLIQFLINPFIKKGV